MEKHYSIGKLRQVIRESSNEFKPVFGKNVPEDNKKINNSAYKDIEKETKDYDGGMVKRDKGQAVTPDINKGMGDLAYDSISKPFADKVKAQIKGFTSAEAEKEHKDEELGNATYNDSKEIEKHAKEVKKETDDSRKGWFDKETIGKDEKTMAESKKMKRITFKKTEFLGEEHMLSRVPDDFKVNGNKFIMKDGSDNAYLVEWADKKPKVTKMLNESKCNQELDRIKELFKYKTKEIKTPTSNFRLNEDQGFSDMVKRAKQLMG